MRHRPLENVLEHIEHLVKAGFKDIRFITPDSLAYLSDDGVHPDYARLEQALMAMQEVAGKAKIKFGEFPSEMRPEFITPELAQLIDRYSDASYLAIGAQSGSERMLEAMHREHDVAAVERAVTYLATYCHKLKKIYVDFIAGLPGETTQDEAPEPAAYGAANTYQSESVHPQPHLHATTRNADAIHATRLSGQDHTSNL